MIYSQKIIDAKNICFFSNYSTENKIPDTTLIYLTELLNYFDKIIVATNNRVIVKSLNNILNSNKIETLKVINEGYDFGMYYKIFKRFKFENINNLCLANDSCIVVNPLDNIINSFIDSDVEYYGITSSNERQTHVQSYFLMMKKNAIEVFFKYLKKHRIKRKYRKVIKYYELGLSKIMLQNKIKIGTFYKAPDDFFINPAYFKVEELIQQKCPIVKKNILTGNFRHNAQKHLVENNFKLDADYYINLVKNNCKNINILPPSIFNKTNQ